MDEAEGGSGVPNVRGGGKRRGGPEHGSAGARDATRGGAARLLEGDEGGRLGVHGAHEGLRGRGGAVHEEDAREGEVAREEASADDVLAVQR